MRRKVRYAIVFLAGLFGGLLLAQSFIVLAGRTGGNFGGEVFPLLAFPLLLVAGFTMGSDHRQMNAFDQGYYRGFRDGMRGYGHEKV